MLCKYKQNDYHINDFESLCVIREQKTRADAVNVTLNAGICNDLHVKQ